MSDIFEIKNADVSLKVGEKIYKFADPLFEEKILLMKEFTALYLKEKDMDYADYLLAHKELNKKQIKIYLPDIEDETLNKLGAFAFTALLSKITEMTKATFGAVVEKIEGK